MSKRVVGGFLGVPPTWSISSGPGIWTPEQQFDRRRTNIWPGKGDPYFANVILLMHLNGTNGSTVFTDSSSAGLTFSRDGNVVISTAQSKFGGASALFDGDGDRLYSLPFGQTKTGFEFGSGDFTIEFWIRFNAVNIPHVVFCAGQNGGGENPMYVRYSVGGGWIVGRNGIADDFTSGALCTANTWHFVAVSRTSGNLRVFLDGTQYGGTQSNSITYRLAQGGLFMGQKGSGSFDYLNGYLDEVRVTKGVGRYTANFTPPTAQFPDF